MVRSGLVRKVSKIVAVIALSLCVLAAGLAAYASSYAAERAQALAFPSITADASAAGRSRGATIFQATCEACHRSGSTGRASGAPMKEVPAWFGELRASNITSHPVAGIGALSDRSLARTIRYGVDREGRWIPMPAYAMSDADIAAVLGFLRSQDPLFHPDPTRTPRSRLSLAGKAALFVSGALSPPARPASGIAAPPRAPVAAYGRYLAEAVYQCGDCHTPGFDPDKTKGPDAYRGGAELKNASGESILSPNLTRDEQTGIGRWSRDQFARAIREGVRPDGRNLGYPMPRFRGADELEVDALFAYLRSFPAKPSASSATGEVAER